ncbi:hypothetical protein K474DRAFT_1704231 [Panus rudis PR-1116 ss-1]|nr:hypothetical protein K474DRAFT_1704231 [Panus rudis PR-1116 ss-1]
MSSSEDNDYESGTAEAIKRRKLQRACDICRQRKVRCDGGSMPENRCSYCVSRNLKCTYVQPAKKRGPPKKYVENLEQTVDKMQRLLKKLCPDPELLKELGDLDKEPWHFENKEKGSPLSVAKVAATVPLSASSPEVNDDDEQSSDDELSVRRDLARKLQHMNIQPMAVRYLGKSSSVMMIHKAYTAKQDFAGETRAGIPLRLQRPKFWAIQPWANPSLDPSSERKFPPEDLQKKLIELFFRHINDYYPLLFRPLFEQQITEGSHLTDERFGSVVLLVCACASKFCDDPRVMLEEADSQLSVGWKYFRQVQVLSNRLLTTPSLLDVQIIVLSAFFLQSSTIPLACWSLVGLGLRMALDVGAHRRKTYRGLNMKKEMWKRTFWILVNMDHSLAMFLGRPTALRDEDVDVDLPVECDDEYWVISENGIKSEQPAGKPSKIAYFNSSIRLTQILGYALRTIYSIKKSKILLGLTGPQWQQNIVAELDSALNKWIDSVPDHLRWNPHNDNELFLNQSALLYSKYYQLQITVHRPFISTPNKPSPLSFPSLTICTNAARSAIHVMEVLYTRSESVLYHGHHKIMFQAAIVLLLNIWGGRRVGLKLDPVKEMADVHKCMSMLKVMEERWPSAGRLGDILRELAEMGDLPLPQDSTAPLKRRREQEGDTPASVTTSCCSGQTFSSSSSDEDPSVNGELSREELSRRSSLVAGKHRDTLPLAVSPDVPFGGPYASDSSPPAVQSFVPHGKHTADVTMPAQYENLDHLPSQLGPVWAHPSIPGPLPSAGFIVPDPYDLYINNFNSSLPTSAHTPSASSSAQPSAAGQSTTGFDFPVAPPLISSPPYPHPSSFYMTDPPLGKPDGFGVNPTTGPSGPQGLSEQWFTNPQNFSWDNWEMLMDNAFPEANNDTTTVNLPSDFSWS